MTVYQPIERLDQITENRYEAVLVAAKHARHLNSKRLAKLARLEEGAVDVHIEARKMTAVALREVLEGKVKFERADTK